ncbi:MAG TPA: trypsin-like peptidase domain-containing protein [Vicinamibacterales bacterium]|jgi:serine protease Do|nr:trypsin-like peptidase domain-containing protein [Vicinamibacterales bacterium]
MSTRKTTIFYVLLSAVLSFAVALVIASRLDLTPSSSAQSLAMPAMNSAPITGALDAQTFRNVAKAEQPMVVNIRTEMRQRTQDLQDFFGGGGGSGGSSPDGDLFHRFFQQSPDDSQAPQGRNGNGNSRRPREQTTQAAGTGFILNKDGLILTNNHVIDGATKIQVFLFGEEADQGYDAKLVGHDQLTDSALIQLVEKPSHALPEAKFGDSSQMAAGDWVMAIGNPFNQGWTVTVGVISAMQRQFQVMDQRWGQMIQTDAAINPGNSGGPLLNLRGEVIGMNTAIISNGGTEGNIGIGFAIPINTVRELLPQLSTGKVTRGRIGVEIGAVPRDGFEDFGLKARTGALVSSVRPGSASEKAGLKPGDVITEYNGRPVTKNDDLVSMVMATRPGTSVPLKIVRDKKEQTLHVTVEELDLEAEQQGARQSRNDSNSAQPPDQQGSDSFGLTLSNVTPQLARRAQLPSGRTGAIITDVDPSGPSASALTQGDVILQVNSVNVATAADAGRELQKVASGRFARILLWRNGTETFVTVKKE